MSEQRFSSRRVALYFSLQAMRTGLGGVADPAMAVIVVLVFTSISWFGEALSKRFLEGKSYLWGFIPLLVILFLLAKLRRFNPKLEPVIKQSPSRAAKIMIWFLSPPGDKKTGDETNPEDMKSWRMAHEAITAQMRKQDLKQVVVVSSSDAGNKPDGSYRFFNKFQSSISTSTGMKKENIVMAPNCQSGVDFEDATELYRVLEAIYTKLGKDGFQNNEIIVDITGGQKMPSILGGVATLVEGRRLQYVSTRDYKISEYDITYGVG